MNDKLWKIWRILFYGMVAEILGYLALFVVSMFIKIPHDIYMGIVIGLGAIYFDSEKLAKKAIETIGEDRIKKYYFGVNKDE